MTREVWVDFNDISEDGRIWTLRKFADVGGAMKVGDAVVAVDHDGLNRPATVESVSGDLVRLALNPHDRDGCRA